MPECQPVGVLPEQELRSRSRVSATAGRSTDTDIDSTAGSDRANHPSRTVAARPARLQARTRRTPIHTEPRALRRAGTDTGAAWAAGRERLARLARARVRDAGAVLAAAGGALLTDC
jgi:hypothetical protein